MGLDPREADAEPPHHVSETTECTESVPYASPAHRAAIGGDVHHFVVRAGGLIVGHAVLNVDAGGMGVAPQAPPAG